jgi:NADPH-dependent curcumin reductase CurA
MDVKSLPSSKAFASTTKKASASSTATDYPTTRLKRLKGIINVNPAQILTRLTNLGKSITTRPALANLAADIVRLWLVGAVAVHAQKLLAADPTVQALLTQNNISIQGLLPSQGYGKRKRSVKSSFAVGRGRKKGRR